MKKIICWSALLIFLMSCKQSKINYLKSNRFDLASLEFDFPQKNFKIIGFGAYHGSAKTEKTEYALLKSLIKDDIIKYYLPETDFSLGHYFNRYLKTGDTLLLKDLIYNYGNRVPQEKSIESYNKWKEIKKLNDKLEEKNKLAVVGIDLLVNYKYTSKHLLELIDYKQNQNKYLQKIVTMIKLDTTDFSPLYNSYSKKVLKQFVEEYEKKPSEFKKNISNEFIFNHIIQNIKHTFKNFDNSAKREQIMYNNYLHLNKLYDFNNNPQFLRFGFFHIEKEREGNNASFFTKLIENKIYKRENIISVVGYLTKSRVLWDILYDDDKHYKSYTTEGGYGIGDYEKEYFRGIENLKQAKISDITLFRLNKEGSPYINKIPDLIEIIMPDSESNGKQVQGKSTTEFLDYAVLISGSNANIPIQEMK